jgi:hypothetical protein
MDDTLAALAEQIPEEVLTYVETLEGDLKKAEADYEELQKSIDEKQDPSDNKGEVTDPIEKALAESPEDVKAIFKAQQDRLEAAETELQEQREARANATWIGKVAAFDGVIDNPDEFGPELRKVADVDPELAESIATALQTATERSSQAALFSEVGKGMALSETDAQSKVESIAKSLQEADPQLSEAEARAEAWKRNPELYDQYVAERDAVTRR